MLFTLTGTCSDPQPHPPTFYKHYGDLAPEVESYLEGVCARWHAQSLCSFSNCLQMNNLVTLDEIFVGKVTIR